ncbi:MAG: nuclear transport factor 2 family protein [Vicinamibacterales bacterium]
MTALTHVPHDVLRHQAGAGRAMIEWLSCERSSASSLSVSCSPAWPAPSDVEKKDDPAATLAAVQRAHDAYVSAINANDVSAWVASLGDDVVYLVPNQKAIVGRDAVGAWASRYLRK